jgi:hypothetical protein
VKITVDGVAALLFKHVEHGAATKAKGRGSHDLRNARLEEPLAEDASNLKHAVEICGTSRGHAVAPPFFDCLSRNAEEPRKARFA